MRQSQDSNNNLTQKEGKIKIGFVIQNNQKDQNNATKRKKRSISPQSIQNQNSQTNQVGYLESQYSAEAKVQKNEKTYISKLETKLKVENKKKIDLVDNNNSLEHLIRLQDQKIQTFIDEIKQLRSYNDQLFKENKQLHLKVESFAYEKNHLIADNKLLKDTVKKLEVRLSFPVRPQSRKNILKTVSEFSRENNYIDGTILANEQTLQQNGLQSNGLPLQSPKIQNYLNTHLSKSNSPSQKENNNLNTVYQSGSKNQLNQRNTNNSVNQQNISSNNQISSPNSSSSNHLSNSQTKQLNLKYLDNDLKNQYFSQNNSQRNSQQFQQSQHYDSAHFNDHANNQNSIFAVTVGAEQQSKDTYIKKLEESIKILEDERGNYQYEIKLLNQALSKDKSNEQMQKLISDLAESQKRITQFTRNQLYLEDKIQQFEKLIDSYTHNNAFEMDRESLEKKNMFLMQENQNLVSTIKALKEELSLWENNNHPQQIQQVDQEKEKEKAASANYLSTLTSRRGDRSLKGNSSPYSNRSNNSSSQTPRTGATQGKSEKLTLAASIKNQKINSKGGDKLSKCCKDSKRLANNKNTRHDKEEGSGAFSHGSSGFSLNIDETRRLLQVEKQKNQLLQKMIEEEQEKNSEYLVYKEEIDFYHQKNKQLSKEILHLQNQLQSIQLSNISIKAPIALNSQSIEQNSVMNKQYNQENATCQCRQTSQSPRRQIKRICNPFPYQGNLKHKSPCRYVSCTCNPFPQVLNYEPRSPCNRSFYNDEEFDQEEGRQRRQSGASLNKGNKGIIKNSKLNSEEESDRTLAFMQIEKELNSELNKKEKNLMQKTLGDQLKIVKDQNKGLTDYNKHLENQIRIDSEELKALRILVKRAEKKNLIGDDFIPSD